jgi:hypothetical protein
MASQSERLASVEQRLADHEARCEERLGEIKASASNTLKAVEGLKSRFWAIALSLLAWALAQVWATSQARLSHLEAAAPLSIQEVADSRWGARASSADAHLSSMMEKGAP